MKITKISVDEQNERFEVTTENGTVYGGYRAMNAIRIKERRTPTGHKVLFADLDDDAIQFRLQPKDQWAFNRNRPLRNFSR